MIVWPGHETSRIRDLLASYSIVGVVCLLSACLGVAQARPRPVSKLRLEISFPESQSGQPLDGHILLGISTDPSSEPRFQLREEEALSAQFFGLDVEGWKPGTTAVIDSTSLGYPLVSLDELPAGDYYVQAVLNIYETFHRADGHNVKLPPDKGEGQKWNRKPGNLFNKPLRVHLDPQQASAVRIELTEKISPTEPPKDTQYIKHLRIESKLLTAFWGRPMYLGATVLLPEGFDEHPTAHYPLLVHHGHFEADWEFFATNAPAESRPDRLSRGQYAYRFHQDWISGRLPRMLLMSIQHANPYFDDSYAVNSATSAHTATPSHRN